jgi:hypothetical protein
MSISLVLETPKRLKKKQLRPLKLKNTKKHENLMATVQKEALKKLLQHFLCSQFYAKRWCFLGRFFFTFNIKILGLYLIGWVLAFN